MRFLGWSCKQFTPFLKRHLFSVSLEQILTRLMIADRRTLKVFTNADLQLSGQSRRHRCQTETFRLTGRLVQNLGKYRAYRIVFDGHRAVVGPG
jgi:hypothetical protein